jgi:hypothetical protein
MLRAQACDAGQSADDEQQYEEKVKVWARAILADQAAVEGGFAPAPIFPVRSISREESELPGPSALRSLEYH